MGINSHILLRIVCWLESAFSYTSPVSYTACAPGGRLIFSYVSLQRLPYPCSCSKDQTWILLSLLSSSTTVLASLQQSLLFCFWDGANEGVHFFWWCLAKHQLQVALSENDLYPVKLLLYEAYQCLPLSFGTLRTRPKAVGKGHRNFRSEGLLCLEVESP